MLPNKRLTELRQGVTNHELFGHEVVDVLLDEVQELRKVLASDAVWNALQFCEGSIKMGIDIPQDIDGLIAALALSEALRSAQEGGKE